MISVLLCMTALLIAWFTPGPAAQLSRWVLHHCGQLGLRSWTAAGSIVAVCFMICVATAWTLFWPVPSVHDEFAYALTADTFINGRLTNASHPFHAHFASWHIIQQPSYQGKYPPAQSIVLAGGQWLAGEPLVGVWISYALAVASLWWASLPWLPRRWAMLATLLVAFNIPMSFAWGNSYWGGAVAMFGGCLLVGGWGRWRQQTGSSGVAGCACGIGLGLLAASRPFEGALMALPMALAWVVEAWQRRSSMRSTGFVVAASASGLACGLALLVYNQAVTGHPLKMPYQVWTAQQGDALSRLLTPAMVLVKHAPQPSTETATGESPSSVSEQAPAEYPAESVDNWRAEELAYWMQVRGAQRVPFTWDKLVKTYGFYLQAVLYLPWISLPWVVRRERGLVVMLLAIGLVTLGCCTHLAAGHPHYVAGLTPMLAILTVAGLRYFCVLMPSFGRPLLGGILCAWLIAAGMALTTEAMVQPHRQGHAWAKRRLDLQQRLADDEQRSGRKQLLFVRYVPGHNVHREWVYNAADIDGAAVVWANDLGFDANERLLDYYRARGVDVAAWLLIVDREGEQLIAL